MNDCVVKNKSSYLRQDTKVGVDESTVTLAYGAEARSETSKTKHDEIDRNMNFKNCRESKM